MRLWHKDLISVLPRQQLLAQWRECCCIARNIAVNGTPNHILLNPIMDYPLNHFYTYAKAIFIEMNRRGYKCDETKFKKYFDNETFNGNRFYSWLSDIFTDWHNDRYLNQCFFNLQEKYDRGGIPADEWEKVEKFYFAAMKFRINHNFGLGVK